VALKRLRLAVLVTLAFMAATLVSPLPAQALGTFNLNPEQGPPGTKVDVTGSGWTPNTAIEVWFEQERVAQGQADANGAISATFTVPANAAEGVHPVSVVTPTGERDFKPFQVTASQSCNNPAVKFSATSGSKGDVVTVTGNGWAPGGTVTAHLKQHPPGAQSFNGNAKVASDGTWEKRFQVGERPAGDYVFAFEEKPECSVQVTETFTVEQATPQNQWVAPMRGNWKNVGPAPGTQYHVGRDRWAIDMSSDNKAIYPARGGTVVYKGYTDKSKGDSSYGWVVAIDHGGGLYSIYAHLAPTGLPSEGAKVTTQDQIGTMSKSGCPSVKNICTLLFVRMFQT
jgi:hypothetical protein